MITAQVAIAAVVILLVASIPAQADGLRPQRSLKNCMAGETPYKIEIQTDNYGEDTRWVLSEVDVRGVLREITRSTGRLRSNRLHTYEGCIEDGQYVLQVDDDYGDGICCHFGDGYIAVSIGGDEIFRAKHFADISRNTFLVGYDPTEDMTELDMEWNRVHNTYREEFHKENGESYVPLKFDPTLKVMAEQDVQDLVDNCDKQAYIAGKPSLSYFYDPLHFMHIASLLYLCCVNSSDPDAPYGTNIFSEIHGGEMDEPSEVMKHWVDQKVDKGWPKNNALTQVMWRGSSYLGCASASKPGCERHVCHYFPAGNCNMGKKSRTGDNWKTPVLVGYSECAGPERCPKDGCYSFDIDEVL